MDQGTRDLVELGRQHYLKREYHRAMEYLDQVLERNGRYADVYNMLGVIRHDQGRLEEAQAAFEEAMAINPDYTEAALNLSVIYNAMGRYAEAKRIYVAVNERTEAGVGGVDTFAKGRIANMHAEVAEAYRSCGLLGEAIAELDRALLLCPEFLDLRCRQARFQADQGDVAGAQGTLRDVLAVDDSFVPALLGLGLLCLGKGEASVARDHFEQVLRIEPGHQVGEVYAAMAKRREEETSG